MSRTITKTGIGVSYKGFKDYTNTHCISLLPGGLLNLTFVSRSYLCRHKRERMGGNADRERKRERERVERGGEIDEGWM